MAEVKRGENKVNYVRERLPAENKIYDLAEFFKVFGDSTRAKILSCLEVCELNVSEIAEALNMSVSAVSHQLRILRSAKLVKVSKRGKQAVYALDDDHVIQIIECGLSHIEERD